MQFERIRPITNQVASSAEATQTQQMAAITARAAAIALLGLISAAFAFAAKVGR